MNKIRISNIVLFLTVITFVVGFTLAVGIKEERITVIEPCVDELQGEYINQLCEHERYTPDAELKIYYSKIFLLFTIILFVITSIMKVGEQ